MADLQLITSKRDIYFATTAPEFIPKDFRIGCLENEQIQECDQRRPSKVNEFSNERILEIRHKIEKIEAQTKLDFSDDTTNNERNKLQIQCDQPIHRPNILPKPDSVEQQPWHINAEDNFSKFLPLPRIDHLPCIQRARSLQKPRDRNVSDDQKRLISKSNSCGDSCTSNYQCTSDFSASRINLKEPSVPPNSPKVNCLNIVNSPSKSRLLKSPNNNKMNQNHLANNLSGNATSNADQQGTEKCKPLRIFRIPLFNLTGTHSHYHTHSSTPKIISTKIQPRKIEEDGLESNESVLYDEMGSNTNETSVDDNCDTIDLRNNFQKLSNNSVNSSLFSSI